MKFPAQGLLSGRKWHVIGGFLDHAGNFIRCKPSIRPPSIAGRRASDVE
jgi:hypothetical protein